MFDQIAIVKCIELKNEQDRARWRRSEDEFYRDLGFRPFERLLSLLHAACARLSGRRSQVHEVLDNSGCRRCGGDQAASARS